MSEWQVNLKRMPEPGEPAFELTVRGDDLGNLIGKVLHTAFVSLDDDHPSLVSLLIDILEVLLCNAVSCEEGAICLLQQVLLEYERDVEFNGKKEDGHEEMRAAVKKVAEGRPDE